MWSNNQTWNWVTFCDPVTRESSDPETQLTRWPCSIMNSKCWLTCMLHTNVCNGKRFASFYRCLAFARFWKVKFLRSFIKCQYFNDDWTEFHKNIYLYIFILGFFRKPEKNQISHRVQMMTRWPGSERWPKWPIDPVTQWPSSMSGNNWLFISHPIHPTKVAPKKNTFL